MHDFYSVLTELIAHAYYLVLWSCVVLIPARMVFNAFISRFPLR